MQRLQGEHRAGGPKSVPLSGNDQVKSQPFLISKVRSTTAAPCPPAGLPKHTYTYMHASHPPSGSPHHHTLPHTPQVCMKGLFFPCIMFADNKAAMEGRQDWCVQEGQGAGWLLCCVCVCVCQASE